MSLVVHTSQIRYVKARKPDALDVTRLGAWQASKAGQEAAGEFLAPSWDLLKSEVTEKEYTERYLAEMRVCYGKMGPWSELEGLALRRGVRCQRARWIWLLSLPRIVLCCYEPYPDFCHRHILRTRILPALGAVDGGEIS